MDEIAMMICMFSCMGVAALMVIVKTVREKRLDDQIEKDLEESLDKCVDEYLEVRRMLGGNGFIENCAEQFKGRTEKDKPKEEKKPPKLTNCKNCGAVLHGNKCEFCDTEYDW